MANSLQLSLVYFPFIETYTTVNLMTYEKSFVCENLKFLLKEFQIVMSSILNLFSNNSILRYSGKMLRNDYFLCLEYWHFVFIFT